MQKNRKLKARILSLAMSVMMVATTIPAPVFAAREGGTLPDAEASGVIVSFDKLEDRFEPSTGKNTSEHVYGLAVELDTPFEDLKLPTELTAMVSRTSVEEAPPEEPKEPETTEAETTEAETTEAETTEAETTEAEITEAETTEAETTEAETTEAETTEAETTEAETTEAETTEAETTESETTESETTESETTEAETTEAETTEAEITEAETTEAEDEKTASTENADDSNIISAFGKTAGDFTLVSEETIPVTWNGNKEYKSDENGKFIYTAVLPEDYILADGVELPQIYVLVGRQARAAAAAITINVNEVVKTGETLEKAVGNMEGGAANVSTLTITAGTVTVDDWKYLNKLTALTDFEIADDAAVTTVANIPDGSSNAAIFPPSIETATVPQAIKIGEYALYQRPALTTASFPKATIIGKSAFQKCKALTSINFSKVTSIKPSAFEDCTALTSASFPKVTSINTSAFASCTQLATLKLGATPPPVEDSKAFLNCPATRALGYVDADGNDLTGDALEAAITAYKANADADGKWNGWTIEPVAATSLITVGGDDATTGYETADAATLQKAFTNIADNGTIKLGADIENLDAGVAVDLSATPKTVTLDTNVCSFNADVTSDVVPLSLKGINLILMNEAYFNLTSQQQTLICDSLHVKSGTYSITSNKNSAVTLNQGDLVVVGDSSLLSISSGGAPKGFAGIEMKDGDIIVNSGMLIVYGPVTILSEKGDITVNGGTLVANATLDSAILLRNGNLICNGGNTIAQVLPDEPLPSPVPAVIATEIQMDENLMAKYKIANDQPYVDGAVVASVPASASEYAGKQIFLTKTPEAGEPSSTYYAVSIYITAKTPTITASAGAGGSISPSGTVTVNKGESQTFAISANSNYSIASVTVDGVNQGAISTHTFSNVTGNHTISATFSYNGGGGGSTGGGGSSSDRQAIWTSVPSDYQGGTKIIGNVRVPDYTVEGAWKKNENGTWNFSGNAGQTYANSWAPVFNPYADVTKGQSAFDWFKFDANGIMITGWYTDTDGNTYYLNPNSDNTLGAMKTGWVLIDGKYYYFNEKPDGTRGKLFQNTRTPDGYLVDENGVSAGK